MSNPGEMQFPQRRNQETMTTTTPTRLRIVLTGTALVAAIAVSVYLLYAVLIPLYSNSFIGVPIPPRFGKQH